MYGELIKRIREVSCGAENTLWWQAADAIAELLTRLEGCEECKIAKEWWSFVHLPQPRWISVEERLPERHRNVLCCGSRGGMFVGWFTNLSTISDGKTIAYVHGGNGRYVTHWMPLPKPPKEE